MRRLNTKNKPDSIDNADLMRLALLNHRLIHLYHSSSNYNDRGDFIIDRISSDEFEGILLEIDNLLKTMNILKVSSYDNREESK